MRYKLLALSDFAPSDETREPVRRFRVAGVQFAFD